MKSVSLVGVSKTFEGRKVLDNLNLHIEPGIFFALLGPSGCGKTTILRLIAGLEYPDSGAVYIGDKNVSSIPAYKRKVNTVFQRQGLFPHLSVFENIAYGLMIRGEDCKIIQEKVERQIKSVNLAGLEKKYPGTLSGGQQQRVALARALVMEPEVLLFDEPLSALDVRLKERMLIECVNLQKAIKTTFIYITHDQKEALTVADKLAIMDFGGTISQIGDPRSIYQKPETRFVANFIGDTTIFSGFISNIEDNVAKIKTGFGACLVNVDEESEDFHSGIKVFCSIRPEKIHLTKTFEAAFSNVVKGTVVSAIYSGLFMHYSVEVEKGISFLVFESDFSFDEGDVVYINFNAQDVVILHG